MLTTCGYIVNCKNEVSVQDSVMIEILRENGAIPFALTNVP